MRGLVSHFTVALLFCSSSSFCHISEEDEASASQPSACYEGLGCFHLNGTFGKVIQALPESPELIQTTFLLFTRHNRQEGQLLDYTDESSLTTGLFKANLNTYVIGHGYMDRGLSGPRLAMRNALLDHEECQVIIVDWRLGAQRDYWLSTVNSELVGRQVGHLIHLLRRNRALNPARVHLIGFSLGAHLVGFTGKWLRREHGLTVGRITALDPASLLFEDSGTDVHVWKDDAEFVDVIHTSAGRELILGQMGMTIPAGHVDFYPNGGTEQPGCPQYHPDCHHLRAEWLFTDSISNKCPMVSFPCPGYESFQKGLCSQCGLQGCGIMGMQSRDADGRGSQYLDTGDKEPFCRITH